MDSHIIGLYSVRRSRSVSVSGLCSIRLHRLHLLRLERFHAAQHLIPVHTVRIELRSIDTDELRLTAYCHAAGTAHTGSIDHDRVERCLGWDSIFGGRECHELHHDSRTDGDTFIDGLAVDDFFYADGYDALLAH